MERNTKRMQEAVQRSWNYNVNFNFDADLVKHISKSCGSIALKDASGYLQFIKYHSGEKFWGFSVDEIGFLYGTFCKKHFRLMEIAVKKESQNKGYGSFMLSMLFEECAKRGINAITLRTSRDETAHLWYRKLGAEYVGTKENDYEMRFTV